MSTLKYPRTIVSVILFLFSCTSSAVALSNTAALSDTTRPGITPSGNQVVCEGGMLTLQASPGFTDYMWSTGTAGRTLIVQTAGSYWVEAKNTSGQTVQSDTVTVTFVPRPQPVIAALNDTVVCPGTPVLLAADAGYVKYEWSNGDTTQLLEAAAQGTYFVRVQNAAGCWGTSNSITVTHKDAPNPSITGTTQMCSNTVPEKYYTNSAPWWVNTWSVTAGTIIGRNDLDTVYVQWDDEARGTLTIAQVDSRTGCTVAVTDSVAVRDVEPVLNVPGDTLICGIPSITISAPAGYDTYMWNTGATTPEIEATEDDDYFVTITRANCVATSDTVSVMFLDAIPTHIDGPAIGCRGDDVVYHATPYAGAVYTWSLESGEVVSGQGTPEVIVNWVTLVPGKIRVDVVKDLCTAADSMDVTVHQVQKPILTLEGAPDLCEGDTLTITATEGYAGYRWTIGDTVRTIRITESGSYAVAGISFTGCSVMSDTIHATVYPYPEKPEITYSDSTLTCTVEGDAYAWYFNGELIAGATQRTLVIHESGVYKVEVVNGNGCSTQSDAMTFTGTGRYAPALAHTFDVSPNPASRAFTVAIAFDTPRQFAVRIVNALGQSVYTHQSAQPQVSWHEKVDLHTAPPGVYFIVVESAGSWDFRKVLLR